MEDLHVVDKRTIANQTISFLNGHKFYSHGLNFGTSAYNSSVELAKFIGLLREVPISERPEYVIFMMDLTMQYNLRESAFRSSR